MHATPEEIEKSRARIHEFIRKEAVQLQHTQDKIKLYDQIINHIGDLRRISYDSLRQEVKLRDELTIPRVLVPAELFERLSLKVFECCEPNTLDYKLAMSFHKSHLCTLTNIQNCQEDNQLQIEQPKNEDLMEVQIKGSDLWFTGDYIQEANTVYVKEVSRYYESPNGLIED